MHPPLARIASFRATSAGSSMSARTSVQLCETTSHARQQRQRLNLLRLKRRPLSRQTHPAWESMSASSLPMPLAAPESQTTWP